MAAADRDEDAGASHARDPGRQRRPYSCGPGPGGAAAVTGRPPPAPPVPRPTGRGTSSVCAAGRAGNRPGPSCDRACLRVRPRLARPRGLVGAAAWSWRAAGVGLLPGPARRARSGGWRQPPAQYHRAIPGRKGQAGRFAPLRPGPPGGGLSLVRPCGLPSRVPPAAQEPPPLRPGGTQSRRPAGGPPGQQSRPLGSLPSPPPVPLPPPGGGGGAEGKRPLRRGRGLTTAAPGATMKMQGVTQVTLKASGASAPGAFAFSPSPPPVPLPLRGRGKRRG